MHILVNTSVVNQIIRGKIPGDTRIHLRCLKCSPAEVHLIQESLLYHYWFHFVVKKENPRKWCLASGSLIDPEFKAVALYLLCFGKDSFENPRGIFVFLHVFCLWLLEKAAVSAKSPCLMLRQQWGCSWAVMVIEKEKWGRAKWTENRLPGHHSSYVQTVPSFLERFNNCSVNPTECSDSAWRGYKHLWHAFAWLIMPSRQTQKIHVSSSDLAVNACDRCLYRILFLKSIRFPWQSLLYFVKAFDWPSAFQKQQSAFPASLSRTNTLLENSANPFLSPAVPLKTDPLSHHFGARQERMTLCVHCWQIIMPMVTSCVLWNSLKNYLTAILPSLSSCVMN